MDAWCPGVRPTVVGDPGRFRVMYETRSSGGLRDGVAHAIVPMHRSDGGVWRVLPLGAHVLLVCRRSFRTRTRDSRGRLVIGTVGFCRLQ